jgi:hypothetical protein
MSNRRITRFPSCARFLVSFICLAGPSACGGESSSAFANGVPYRPGEVTVLGDDEGDSKLLPPAGCDSKDCDDAVRECDAQDAADVVVDASGKVVDVICYEPDVRVVDAPAEGPATAAALGNNTLLVIDGANDGVDVVGDVTLAGNNDAIYGQGAGVSVIGGTVDVQKNNARIRGVRISQDVVIDKNNTKMLFCVIDGNLTISGNNTTIADCDVFGTTTVTGQNTVLVGDRFGTPPVLDGGNMVCSADVAFVDQNADDVIAPAEVGTAVLCGN